MITRLTVKRHLLDYLNRRLTLAGLVDWAENAMMDDAMDEADIDVLTPIVARLGLADVREFGLSWDDCYDFLNRLGYRVAVVATPAR
jgi:hypothetical protein